MPKKSRVGMEVFMIDYDGVDESEWVGVA